MDKDKKVEVISKVLYAIIQILVFGAIVMFLWDAVLTDLFNLSEITYAQAIGIYGLSRILFSKEAK